MLSHFQVKVCGVTTGGAAAAVSASQADAVGLNFYPDSARFLDDEGLDGVLEGLRPDLLRIGVFVNADLGEIERRAGLAELDLIQLHGDEPVEMLADLPAGRVIRAIRCRDGEGLAEVRSVIASADRQGTSLAAVLVDAYQPGAYGGTGRRLDWNSLAGWRAELGNTPLILAGGLTPANVAEAISLVQPSAVDTAGGVESAPGEKDAALTSGFASAAMRAFADLD